MKRVTSVGNVPNFLKVFLVKLQPSEDKETHVYDCTYEEIISKAKEEKLEPQVLIDKAITGKAFLCAVGASVRHDAVSNTTDTPPVFYYAELTEERKRAFQNQLYEARSKAMVEAEKRLELAKIVKKNTREAGREIGKERITSRKSQT